MIYGCRQTRGVVQDLHLSAAARLAGETIDEHFYESSHNPGTYARLTSWQYKRQQALNAASFREVSGCSHFTLERDTLHNDLVLPSDFLDFKAGLMIKETPLEDDMVSDNVSS